MVDDKKKGVWLLFLLMLDTGDGANNRQEVATFQVIGLTMGRKLEGFR